MSDLHRANRDQAALWNEAAGRNWVEMQVPLDAMLAPFSALLVEHSHADEKAHVLDVGCGAGATTLSMARSLGPQGRCVGVDISATLIDLAKSRAIEARLDKVSFVVADAQTHPFEPHTFDSVISRFGLMFFDDPAAAFANIRRAVRPGASLTFVAWRAPAENPFMTTAARAAAPFLPPSPPPDPNAPGQFALADPDRVRRILAGSGWANIDIRPIDAPTSVTEKDLQSYVTRMGPVGLALREMDEEKRARVSAVVRAAFDAFIQNGTARFSAACWLVNARG